MDKLQVGFLITTADIVYFSELAFLNGGIKSPAVVRYKDPVSDIEAITIDAKGPVGAGAPDLGATKVGRAKSEGILFFSFGDASITQAAANGRITRVHQVDSESLNLLGLYARYETIVYGE